MRPTRRGEGRVHSHIPYLRPKRTTRRSRLGRRVRSSLTKAAHAHAPRILPFPSTVLQLQRGASNVMNALFRRIAILQLPCGLRRRYYMVSPPPTREGGTAQIVGKFFLRIVLRWSSSQYDNVTIKVCVAQQRLPDTIRRRRDSMPRAMTRAVTDETSETVLTSNTKRASESEGEVGIWRCNPRSISARAQCRVGN